MTELSLLIRATVILVMGLGTVVVSRSASASTRSLWLAVTFGALLLFPIATATLPPARVVVPMPPATPPAVRQASAPAHRAPSTELVTPAMPHSAAPVSLREWLVGVWLRSAPSSMSWSSNLPNLRPKTRDRRGAHKLVSWI